MWESVKNQSHSNDKLVLAAVQDTRNRQDENDLQNKEATSGELSTKTVKAVTEVRGREGRDKEFTRNKLRESGCRGYRQSEARLGDQRN